ncbi:SPOR domain-containing protein [Actinotalea sp. C106]|uniref:SPOR domain-containing protein n=1 Tax=Actinotalea sp. C106 TaxID=2908644 RepID=UPI0020289E2B|nr:SPOR domain-containing protein [Actinotalea sp. C106]
MSEDQDPTRAARWFYDPSTGEVEQGRQSSWQGRMGPYETREEATEALEKARRRNEAWEEEDRRRRDEDDSWGVDPA